MKFSFFIVIGYTVLNIFLKIVKYIVILFLFQSVCYVVYIILNIRYVLKSNNKIYVYLLFKEFMAYFYWNL